MSLARERGASPRQRIVGAEAQRVWCLRCSELRLPGMGAWPGARLLRRVGPVLGPVAGRLAGHEWVLLKLTPENVRKKQGQQRGLAEGPRTWCYPALPQAAASLPLGTSRYGPMFLTSSAEPSLWPPAPAAGPQGSLPALGRLETAQPLRPVVSTRHVALPPLEEGCGRASLELVQPYSPPRAGLSPSQCPEKQNRWFLSQLFLPVGPKPGEGGPQPAAS